MVHFQELFIYILFVICVQCRIIITDVSNPTTQQLAFMKRYGYLPSDEDGGSDYSFTPESMSDAIKNVQRFGGLPQTGIIDEPTEKLFHKRRCGAKDMETNSNRRRRFVIQQGWTKRRITYKVDNSPSTLSKTKVEQLMERGFSLWAPYGNLKFTKKNSKKVDILVSFASGDHGDGSPFDGPGIVVAHAFPPPMGSMHFDNDELWGENEDGEDEDTTDFLTVAVHEIGHALGLGHSPVKAAIMYPYYKVPVSSLHSDDIMGMHDLYLKTALPETSGESEDEVDTTERSTSVSKSTKPADDGLLKPDICTTNYDSITVINNKLFVFKDKWMWVYRDRKIIEDGSPIQYHDYFKGLPLHVNFVQAIYERENGDIVIFSGTNYWVFDSQYNLNSMHELSDYALPPGVSELNAAFLSNYNNKTYLFNYGRFWRYNERTQSMDIGYPKAMAAWRGIPRDFDFVFVWKGDTFFFKGGQFWRFDNRRIKAHEAYPAPTTPIWFGCPELPSMFTQE